MCNIALHLHKNHEKLSKEITTHRKLKNTFLKHIIYITFEVEKQNKKHIYVCRVERIKWTYQQRKKKPGEKKIDNQKSFSFDFSHKKKLWLSPSLSHFIHPSFSCTRNTQHTHKCCFNTLFLVRSLCITFFFCFASFSCYCWYVPVLF